MERITVPAAKVLETLTAVATENPGYVYAAPEHQASESLSCYYVHKDENGENVTPGCLVGKVLNVLGVSLEALSRYEGSGAYSVTATVLEVTGQPDEIRAAHDALGIAQNAQDAGATWGDALERATRKPGE